jgi:hypothetical protein
MVITQCFSATPHRFNGKDHRRITMILIGLLVSLTFLKGFPKSGLVYTQRVPILMGKRSLCHPPLATIDAGFQNNAYPNISLLNHLSCHAIT